MGCNCKGAQVVAEAERIVRKGAKVEYSAKGPEGVKEFPTLRLAREYADPGERVKVATSR
jgi:hypothetical protein